MIVGFPCNIETECGKLKFRRPGRHVRLVPRLSAVIQHEISRGQMAFALIAVLASILFVRLGFWQLDRHAEKREAAALREARLAEPPVSLATLLEQEEMGPAGEGIEWRRVALRGRWDPAGEVLIRNRVLNGRPGVHVVTPLVLDPEGRTSTAAASEVEISAELLVLRGWMAAPDAMTPGPIAPPARTGRNDEPLIGVIRTSRDGAGGPMLLSGEGAERRPSFAAIDVAAIERSAEDSASYLPVFVQLLPEEKELMRSPMEAGTLIRVPLPEPGSGPHLAYAVQWFFFAAISLIGTVAYIFQPRRRSPARGPSTEGPSRS